MHFHRFALRLCASLAVGFITLTVPLANAQSAQDNAAAALGGSLPYYPDMTPEQRRGMELWFKATMNNAHHHSYVLPQRLHAPIDFYRVFGSAGRDSRFAKWGVISDPDCKPATADSFGFDVCPGDEDLLNFVGKPGYRDPACGFDQGKNDGSEDPCLLSFGTSTGGLGFRKFPNPRFSAHKWRGWEHFNAEDGSQEPPFLFGTSCGSCHVGMDPNHPPKDPEHPTWANISGSTGNDFLFNQQIFLSGTPKNSLNSQALYHARPGTTDTSAVPNDMLDNTSTINAIINFDKRPTFTHDVARWRRAAPGQPWVYDTKKETILNILKGGEDTVGVDLAVERVYVNIGMCAEQCWQNNIALTTSFNGYTSRQHPFNINQCRSTCPEWRALENRVDSIIAYLVSRRPTDLKDAVDADGGHSGQEHLAAVKAKLDPEFAAEGGVNAAGSKVFAKTCARCHSSQKPVLPGQRRDERFFANVDFLKTDAKGVRIDWLGNDERTDVSIIGTNRCRALHTNHGAANVYGEFSSTTFKNWAQPSGVPELTGKNAEGRGYYRNISLLSLWAHAPFMHNNGIGVEYCSDHNVQNYKCEQFSPDVASRLRDYEISVKQLLYPETRTGKVDLTTADIDFLPALNLPFVGPVQPLKITLPKGIPAGMIGSMNIPDLVNGEIAKAQSEADASGETDPIKKRLLVVQHFSKIFATKETVMATLAQYTTCADYTEDTGHTFGAELSDHDKTALIQYMKNF